jgi:hypothetical protein
MPNLMDQLEIEIREVSQRLTFWQDQLRRQSETHLGNKIRSVVAGYEVQLDQLKQVRKLVDEQGLPLGSENDTNSVS